MPPPFVSHQSQSGTMPRQVRHFEKIKAAVKVSYGVSLAHYQRTAALSQPCAAEPANLIGSRINGMRTFQRGLQIDCEQKPPIDQCPVILVRQTSRGQRGIPVDAAVMHCIMYQPARPFIAYGTHCPGHFRPRFRILRRRESSRIKANRRCVTLCSLHYRCNGEKVKSRLGDLLSLSIWVSERQCRVNHRIRTPVIWITDFGWLG